MDTGWLAVFRQIAATGSFTAAGKALGYTQSAVSRQMAALENDLDATLFDRRARGVRLTEAGTALLRHAEAVVDRLDVARRELSDLANLATGRLRIGSFASAGVELVPRTIAGFRAAHPGILISHVDGLSRDLATGLLKDDLDLALINGYPDQIEALEPLRLRHLFDEPILVALPKEHRLADRAALRLSDLADEHWIAGSASPQETLIRAALRQGFQPRIEYVVQEWTAKQGFVAAGLGVTLIPALALGSLRPDLTVVALHPQDAPVRGVYAATSPATRTPAAVSAFESHLDTVIARLPLG